MRLPTIRDNNAEELRAFDETCNVLGGFDDRVDFEWADGFLTTLAASRQLPPTAEWLEAMCGDAFDRAFADPEAYDRALRALKTRLAVLREQLDPEALYADPESLRLNPLMSEWTEEGTAAALAEGLITPETASVLQTGSHWAMGVLEGIEAFPEMWIEPEEEEDASYYQELYAQIEALILPKDDPELAVHLARTFGEAPATRDDLITQACFAVQDLRLFWVDRAPRPAMRRVDKAPGRNDPCPCGSGKKFKKCHGSAAG